MTTSSPVSIKVILGSTREGRFGDKPAHWILGEAARLPGVEAELLDLRNFPLSFFDRPVAPAREGGVYADPSVTGGRRRSPRPTPTSSSHPSTTTATRPSSRTPSITSSPSGPANRSAS
jgi:hypothetical protein